MNRDFALKLIEKTKADYNRISDHFNLTRGFSWKEFESFAEYIKPEDKVLDLGCGNGRLLEFLISNFSRSISGSRSTVSGKFQISNYFGLDISEKLVNLAIKNHPEANVQVGDFLELPFDDNKFDTIISIAAFHHIPSEELRLEALAEIKRVLENGGTFIFTVWNLLEQEKYLPFIKNSYPSSEVKRNREAKKSSPQGRAISDDDYDIGDSLIPWSFSDGKKGTLAAKRYYHAFTEEELNNLVKKSGFEILKLEKIKFNFLVVLKK